MLNTFKGKEHELNKGNEINSALFHLW